jgi:NADH-quinone oxidoreductase subunit G
VAARSPTPRPAPRSSGPGGLPRGRCRPSRAATPPGSWPPRRRGSWPRWWSAGSTRSTWPDPAAALTALREVGFLVSLELHTSPVTELADVVLPVAPDAQRAGSYVNWEGRRRPFGPALDATGVLPDCRVLDTLAVEMDVDLFTQTPAAAAGELARLGTWSGPPAPALLTPAGDVPRPGYGQAVLATWRQLVDDSTLAVDEPALAGTARPAYLRVNAATAERLGLIEGAPGTVRTERGEVTLPVALTDLPDGVVWLPTRSGESQVRARLGAGHGDLVGVSA